METNDECNKTINDDKETRDLIEVLQSEHTENSEVESNKNNAIEKYLQNCLSTFNGIGNDNVKTRKIEYMNLVMIHKEIRFGKSYGKLI